MSRTRPIHVCSLSMSALREVDQLINECTKTIDQLDNEEKLKADEQFSRLNKFRWAQLAMQYNQHKQLQYIYQQMGDKSSHPEFRQIKMKPIFNFWRKQIMRDNWLQLHKAICMQAAEKKIQNKADYFVKQRSLIAAKSFKDSIDLYSVPIGLVDLSPLDYLMSFRRPRSCGLNFENMECNLEDSDAIQDFSSTFDQVSSDENETFEGRYRQEFIKRAKGPGAPVKIQSRGVVGDDFDTFDSDDDGIFILPSAQKKTEPEPEQQEPILENEHQQTQQETQQQEQALEIKKEEVVDETKIKEESKKQEETPVSSAPAKKSSKMVYIIALCAVIAVALVYFMFLKGGNDVPVQTKKK